MTQLFCFNWDILSWRHMVSAGLCHFQKLTVLCEPFPGLAFSVWTFPCGFFEDAVILTIPRLHKYLRMRLDVASTKYCNLHEKMILKIYLNSKWASPKSWRPFIIVNKYFNYWLAKTMFQLKLKLWAFIVTSYKNLWGTKYYKNYPLDTI